MKHYIGLDVSLKLTSLCIVDETGKVVMEKNVETNPEVISAFLTQQNLSYERIGIESGQLSIFLCKTLLQKGFPVICVDARHMSKVLSARINKNDRNDARGIAEMMRAGLYKVVQVKSDESCCVKVLLNTHAHLTESRRRAVGQVRGQLKIFGIKIGCGLRPEKFIKEVSEKIKSLDIRTKNCFRSLLSIIEQFTVQLAKVDKALEQEAKRDQEIQRLMTVPGVGIITALTFKVTLDDPKRFTNSESVGAYLGLTPRQYSSGEVNRQGGISCMGASYCRRMLYEAAQSLLTRVKAWTKLKAWGMKLARKKGMKKAIVAVARKLSVMMHRMLITQQSFSYQI